MTAATSAGRLALAFCFGASLTISCGGSGDRSSGVTPPPAGGTTPVVTAITLSSAALTLEVGATDSLSASLTTVGTPPAGGWTTSWTTSDANVASVSPSGVVAAIAVGTAAITATAGGKTASAVVTVTASGAALSVTIAPASVGIPLGIASRLTATVRDAAGTVLTGQPITWSSSDAATAAVDPTGLVVTGRTGSATITASTGLSSGQAVVTVGTAPPIAACKLPNRTGAVGLGLPRLAPRLRTTGTVRATVLFVDFSDAPAARTPQNVFDILQPTAPNFYATVSYGAMNLVLQPNLRWLRMSKPSTQYGWPNLTFAAHLAFLQEAADLAAGTTDFSQTDLLVVMTNPDAGGINNGPAFVPNAGGGIRVAGRASTIDNATNSGRDLLAWGGIWLDHEMGHLMSLADLYDYAPQSGPSLHQHVGEWSLMGLISGRGAEWTAFERWQLGWLGDDQMVCAPSGTSLVSLTPIETAGGVKAALLPLSPTLAVVVESRRALGYDARIPQPGPLVYFVDTSVGSGRGTMRVLPEADTDAVKLTRTLLVGQAISYRGATVTLMSRGNGADVVQVARP